MGRGSNPNGRKSKLTTRKARSVETTSLNQNTGLDAEDEEEYSFSAITSDTQYEDKILDDFGLGDYSGVDNFRIGKRRQEADPYMLDIQRTSREIEAKPYLVNTVPGGGEDTSYQPNNSALVIAVKQAVVSTETCDGKTVAITRYPMVTKVEARRHQAESVGGRALADRVDNDDALHVGRTAEADFLGLEETRVDGKLQKVSRLVLNQFGQPVEVISEYDYLADGSYSVSTRGEGHDREEYYDAQGRLSRLEGPALITYPGHCAGKNAEGAPAFSDETEEFYFYEGKAFPNASELRAYKVNGQSSFAARAFQSFSA